jgi:hypothetical protein
MTQTQNPFDVLRLLNEPCKKPKVVKLNASQTSPIQKKDFLARPKPFDESHSASEDSELEDCFSDMALSNKEGKHVRFDLTKTQVIVVERRPLSREEKKERRKSSKQEYRAKKQKRMKGF